MRYLFFLFPVLLAAQNYDIVLKNGRVMDPESGLDAVRNVGITGKKITAISTRPLRGKVQVDASGLVIAPGFIDLHQHRPGPQNYQYKAMDGVTTALELELGVSPVGEWYAAREGKALINFGASSSYTTVRMRVMGDTGDYVPRDAAMNRKSTAQEQNAIEAAIQKGMDEGGLGIGLGVGYTPSSTAEEILNLFYIGTTWKRPIFVHMRDAGNARPGVFESLQEILGDAAASGASVHVMHINSMAQKKTPEALRMIEGARARGLDVTTEAYPYIAGSTRLESALFEPGWQEKMGGTFSDVIWVETGERLTEESFARYRKQGGRIVIFQNTEESIRAALANPLVMVASDGGEFVGHPRTAGTYARVLGKYVREEKALTLMEAIRKSTLMPARRLEAMAPQMRQKGRLRVGADADISVFNPNKVIDKATFEKPGEYSEGFRFVLVNGTFVVRDGKPQENVTPGEGIRAR